MTTLLTAGGVVLARVVGLPVVVARVRHRWWLADIEREDGPAAAQIADAEWAAGRVDRPFSWSLG